MGDNNIDKIFRDKLEQLSQQPPQYVWDEVQSQLAAKRKKRRIGIVSWIAAAAVVVFAFIAGWVFNSSDGDVLVQTKEVVESRKPESKASTFPIDSTADQSSEEKLLASSEEMVPNEELTQISENVQASTIEEREQTLVRSEESYRTIKGKETIVFNFQDSPQLMAMQTKETEPVLTQYEIQQVQENIMVMNKNGILDNKNWALGMHIAPGYSSQVVNHSAQYLNIMNSNTSGGGSNLSGGISVQYKTGKKIRIESGVYYAQNGQVSSNSMSLFAFHDDRQELSNGIPDYALDAGSAPKYSNKIQVENNTVAMNSAAGVIAMNEIPRGAMILNEAGTFNPGFSNQLITDGEFSQQFQFVEIPLYLRYSVLDKRFAIELMGGFNTGIVVGNKAYLDNVYGLQHIGNTRDINSLNIAGTLGMGIKYKISRSFSLAVEPRINYYLNSLSQNPDVNYHPYRLGLYSGVYYEF